MPNLTALENVEIAVEICKDHLEPKDVLTEVGLDERLNNFPAQLSGGEQQRIAIARAILNKPKLIIADEPTGNLDPVTAENIIALLRQISQTGTSVIMSTHNMPLLDKYPGVVYRCIDGILEEVTNDYNKISAIEENDTSDPCSLIGDYGTREDLSI